jgi:hypothetical protein
MLHNSPKLIAAVLLLFLALNIFYVAPTVFVALRVVSKGGPIKSEWGASSSLADVRLGHIMQRILIVSQKYPGRPLSELLREQIVCSGNCPVFHSNISKFAKEEEIASRQTWSKVSQSPELREVSLRMWDVKRLDVAAARTLGCAVWRHIPLSGARNETIEEFSGELFSGTNGMCKSNSAINLLLPLVVHHHRGRQFDRHEYITTHHEWYVYAIFLRYFCVTI